MGIAQTKQTKTWVLTMLEYGILVLNRQNRTNYGFFKTEQIEKWHKPDRKVTNNQRKETEIWVLNKPNKPKNEKCPGRTEQNMGFDQTEQTEM